MSEGPQVIAQGLQFPEGPVALPDGSVLVVELARGTLSRVTVDGTVDVVAECGGAPNGAAIGPDGAVYVCNNGGQDFAGAPGAQQVAHVTQGVAYVGGSIQRVDLSTAAVTTLYTECDGNPLLSPNDLVFDHTGGFWFTDTGKTRRRDRDWGGVYYAQPDGSSIREVIHPLDNPNGVGLSPDGSRLYVAETTTGRLWWWTVRSAGVLDADRPGTRGGHLLAGPGGAMFFDSLAVEADGNVCVATLFHGGVTVVSPDGAVEFVPVPDRLVTNLCFGGRDMTTAYLTLSSSGRLAAMPWRRPGLRLAF
jgi:gluconolactonase